MKKFTGKSVGDLLEHNIGLNGLLQTFAILDELNQILKQFLPPHLSVHCKIGAIDSTRNIVILYVNDPALKHIILRMANPIMEQFNRQHFSFSGLVTKVRLQPDKVIAKPKQLEAKVRDKLRQFAESINRVDLIEEKETVIEENEIIL